MYSIAVVEDEPKEAQKINSFLKNYLDESNIPCNIYNFKDGDEIIEEKQNFDIILLDIEMKRMDGITAARRIRKKDEHVIIVFITRMVNMAIEGYSVDASDFIIKPLNYLNFKTRMDRIFRKISLTKERFIEIKNGTNKKYININDIDYIEAANKKISIYLINGTNINTTEPLYRLEEKLLNEGFYKPHNSYLVNLSHVTSLNNTDIKLKTNTIPLSKHRKKDFLNALTTFKGNIL
ncbi:MAG: LytR/AlgR family response regulator transcription factor [Erysipelotrichaceae bacterium]